MYDSVGLMLLIVICYVCIVCLGFDCGCSCNCCSVWEV